MSKHIVISQKLGTQDVGLGGPGSGNWAHAGRPGQRGGSQSNKSVMSVRGGKDWQARQNAAKEDAKRTGTMPYNAPEIDTDELAKRILDGKVDTLFRDYTIGSESYGRIANVSEPIGSGIGTLSVSFSKADAKRIPSKQNLGSGAPNDDTQLRFQHWQGSRIMYQIRNTPEAIKMARALGASIPRGASGEAWYRIPDSFFDWGDAYWISGEDIAKMLKK